MTVHKIIEEVYEAIIRNLWKPLVQAKFSNHQREYYGETVNMTAFWQSPAAGVL